MQDLSRFLTSLQLAALCAALSAGAACGDRDAGRATVPPKRPELRSSSQGLAEGRTVTVQVPVWDSRSEKYLPVTARQQLLLETRDGVGGLLRDSCEAGYGPDGRVELCIASWALTFAESVTPFYIGRRYNSDFHEVASDPSVFSTPEWDAPPDLTIPPPTATDAASWAYLAFEQFRESLLTTTDYLVQCNDDCLSDEAAAQLAEALAGMTESADKTRTFIISAFDADSTRNPDADRAEAWKGVVDSRLMAANVYARVPHVRFRDNALLPLYAIDGGEFLTTREVAALPDRDSERGSPVAWVIAPTVDPSTAVGSPVFTLHNSDRSPCTTILDQESRPCRIGQQYDWEMQWFEGWTAPAGKGLPLASTGDGYREFVFPATDPPQEGYTLAHGSFFLEPDHSQEWPVLPARALDGADRMAAELIRTYQLNPFQSGEALSADLYLAVKADHAQSAVSTPAELISRLRVTQGNLEAAAARIVLEAKVLGQALDIIPGTAAPVRYTIPRQRLARVDPAYLYARLSSAAAAQPSQGDDEPSDDDYVSNKWHERRDFARSGLLNAAWYVANSADLILPQVHGDGARVFARSMAYARELSAGMYVVTPTATEFTLAVDGTSGQELAGRFDMYIGEGGLECATTGRIGGRPCLPSDYSVAPSVAVTSVAYSLAHMPARAFGALQLPTAIPEGTRFYLIERQATGAARSVGGFEFTSSGARQFPFLNDHLREALTSLLAVDPEDPSDPLMSCAGVETNVRVKLEDELIPVNLDDSIDSSFHYYLTEARKAADFADSLGEQLIEQGLSMDTRAEDAAQDLEQLCGGTINVGRLQELACELANCDLGALLAMTTEGLGAFASEVEGARDCFGGRVESEPVMAAVGDQALCAWRFIGADNARMYQPCQPCPAGAGCPKQCPFIGTPSECDKLLAPFAGIVEPVYITDSLGLTVTAFDEKPTPQTLGSWIQTRYGLAVDPTYPTRAAGNTFTGWLGNLALAVMNGAESREIWGSWATQANLRTFAQGLGYIEKDDDLVVTLGNNRWFSVRDAFEHFERDPAGAPWPCRGMPGLEEACKWGNGSLLCGACAGSNPSNVASRVRHAIDALKLMTGASFDNAYVRQDGLSTELDLRSRGDFAYAGLYKMGLFEEPFYTASSLDGTTQLRCTEGQGINALQQALVERFGGRVERPLVGPEQMHCSWSQRRAAPGTLADPVFLWSEGACLGKERGCGAIPDFLAGRTDRIEWSSAKNEYCYVWQETGSPKVNARCVESAASDACSALGQNAGCEKWTCATAGSCRDRPIVRPTKTAMVTGLPQSGHMQCSSTETCKGVQPSTRRVGGTLTGREVLDALSIAYRISAMGAGGCDTLWTDIPKINSVHDFTEVRKALMCSADGVERQLTRMYLPGVPRDVLEAMRSGTGTFPSHRGEYGEVLANLVSASQNLNRQSDAVVQAIRDIGLSFDLARTKLETLDLDLQVQDLDSYINTLNKENSGLQLENVELENKIANLRKGQAIANQATSCLVATFNALPTVSCGFPSGCSASQSAGAPFAATATCVNSATQIGLEAAIGNITDKASANSAQQVKNDLKALEAVSQKLQLGKQATEQEKRLALLEIQQDVLEKADSVNEASTALNETYASIHSLLTRLDTIRSRSRRAASKVLLLDNDDVGRQFNVNTAMRARMNTLRVRYGNARQRAIRAAYMARRAVEQKLGVDLEDMTEDVGWLEAPSKWARTLCALPGIDYARIRDAKAQKDGGEAGTTTDTSNADPFENNGYNYANAYIGDYVTKLEQFIEAYRYEYPFQDGSDTVVVSLRDELIGIREDCDVQGPNLLYNASTCLGSDWESGCEGEWCLSAQPTDEHPLVCDGIGGNELDLADDQERTCRAMGGASAVELRYAVRMDDDDGEGEAAELPTYRQSFPLAAGDHWVSWHEQTSCVEEASVLGSVSLDDGPWVAVMAGGCVESRALSPTVHAADRWIAPGWSRRFGVVNVPGRGTLRLAFRPAAAPVPGVEPDAQPSVFLAAPQVEKLEQPLSQVPAEFFPTDDDLMAKVGQCEDSDGDTFRGAARWKCESYCPSAVGEGCEELAKKSDLPRRCYYELPFMISQSDIEDGRLIPHGGFALGNFNYRHDKLAVNVVGTNVKDCASSGLPSACYANNFLQFTLHHDEPFRVRAFDGRDFHAPLFPGRIQQGKALMAERYLTNPLSGADRGLLTDYWRTEFRGRPVEGAYTLRIYYTEGFDFSTLQDVQLLMNYRYWTRLQ